jgi:hypothetical protein
MRKRWFVATILSGMLLGSCAHHSARVQHESDSKAIGSSAKSSKPNDSAAPADKIQAVAAAIDAWASAWSARDVDAYLAAYAPDFKPEKGSRSEWEKQRRERIGKARSIKVTVGAPQITSSARGHATARFTQIYESDTHADTAEKKLEFRWVDGKWLITRETSL